jgi:preprotein translocase subunit YajC
VSNLLAWLPLAQTVPLAQALPAAQTDAPLGGGPWQMLLLMGAIFIGMYALMIYPQRKQQREHEKMLQQIQRGDQVITSGGIHGRVTGVADDVLTVEIAERVRIKVNRSAIGVRIAPAAGERARGEREKDRDAGEREKETKA